MVTSPHHFFLLRLFLLRLFLLLLLNGFAPTSALLYALTAFAASFPRRSSSLKTSAQRHSSTTSCIIVVGGFVGSGDGGGVGLRGAPARGSQRRQPPGRRSRAILGLGSPMERPPVGLYTPPFRSPRRSFLRSTRESRGDGGAYGGGVLHGQTIWGDGARRRRWGAAHLRRSG